MNNWQSTIETLTLTKYPQPCDGPILAPLGDYRLLTIKGEDAIKFLQGQCTCDFTGLEQGLWLLGAHCNAQGRMHSSFYAAKLSDDTIGLRIHKTLAESALNALLKYSVFSKVKIEIQAAWMIGFHLSEDAQHLPGTSIARPQIGQVSHPTDDSCLLQLDGNCSELWLTHSETFQQLWPKVSSNITVSPNEYWQLQNIIQGRAEVQDCSAEQLLPQELNYQLIDGVSFSKGCYTGQEIIARMHYKATLKKHLYRCQYSLTDDPTLAKYGTNIRDSDSAKKLGSVIHCVQASANTAQMLVLVNDEAVTQNNAVLELQSQVKLSWLPLPYAIP